MSHWGPVPARADSVTAAFRQGRSPAWAVALDVPYEIVRLPLRLAVSGVRETASYLDRAGVIYRVSRLLKPRELPYGVVLSVSAGGLSGFGGGATAVHDAFFGEDNRFRLGFKASTTGNNRVVLGTHFGVARTDEIQLGAGYRVRPNARFYGVGPRSREADEASYTHEMAWVGATYERHVASWLSVELAALYTGVGARGPGHGDEPSIASVFDETLPRGFGSRSDGTTLGLTLESDTTERTGTPEEGAVVRLGASRFLDGDGSDTEYWSYRAEAQTFLPLWFEERVLALRAFYTWIDPTGASGGVPFQRLMTNDDPDLLRGYKDYRWRDRGMAVATAEYRWPVWAGRGAGDFGLHMYLFTDVGQVFGATDELALANLTESFGAGFRAVGLGGFVGRVELGHSAEETVVRVRADQLFQFQRGGLYHGRNPIPSR